MFTDQGDYLSRSKCFVKEFLDFKTHNQTPKDKIIIISKPARSARQLCLNYATIAIPLSFADFKMAPRAGHSWYLQKDNFITGGSSSRMRRELSGSCLFRCKFITQTDSTFNA